MDGERITTHRLVEMFRGTFASEEDEDDESEEDEDDESEEEEDDESEEEEDDDSFDSESDGSSGSPTPAIHRKRSRTILRFGDNEPGNLGYTNRAASYAGLG